MEIFKLATRLNIKPKDVIGMGGDIVKMGKSLFNTRINPELTKFVNEKGRLPEKITEEIKLHMRTLKNASESQLELFKLNLKDLVNAKFPPKADVVKLPVPSDKRLVPSNMRIDKEVTKMMDDEGPIGALESIVKNTTPMNSKKYLIDEIKRYNKNVSTENKTIDELKEILMRLDTDGIPFADGGIANHFRNK